MTTKQVEILKYFLIKSQDGSDFIKKILFALLDASENDTKEVHLTLDKNTMESVVSGNKFYSPMQSLFSCKEETHLHQLCALAGSKKVFSFHAGGYRKDFSFDGELGTYTVWFAESRFGRKYDAFNEISLTLTLDQINEVPLDSEVFGKAKA